MKLMSLAAMSAAVVTGLAGAGVAYEIASAGGPAPSTSATGTADVTKPAKRWAPCERPAVLEKGACVTDVVRTVVLSATGARLGTVSGRSSSDDGPFHDAFDDHGDDDFDDDDAFDDHDDDDAFEDHDDDDGHHSGSDDSGGDEDHSGHGGDDGDDSGSDD